MDKVASGHHRRTGRDRTGKLQGQPPLRPGGQNGPGIHRQPPQEEDLEVNGPGPQGQPPQGVTGRTERTGKLVPARHHREIQGKWIKKFQLKMQTTRY